MADRRVSLSWHSVGDVTVIRTGSSVSASALDREATTNKIAELVRQSSGKVVLDLSEMEMLDSRTLAMIVSLNRKLAAQGGQLRLCRVLPMVAEMFDAFGLLKILNVDETEEDSITALKDLSGDTESTPL